MENDSVKISLKRKLPRKLKPIWFLRSTEIDAFLSDSGSEGSILFDDDTFSDPNFSEKCQIIKCKKEGKNNCLYGMLVCQDHYNLEICGHDDHYFDSEEDFKKKKKLL